MKILLFILLAIVVSFTTNTAVAQSPLHGKVIKIIDGDTYDILLDNHTTKRIRMKGIDAPERGHAVLQIIESLSRKFVFWYACFN